jgi:hypothetical protein
MAIMTFEAISPTSALKKLYIRVRLQGEKKYKKLKRTPLIQ